MNAGSAGGRRWKSTYHVGDYAASSQHPPKEVEYIFMCLLAIRINSFTKNIFKSLSQFPIMVFMFSY